MLDAVTDQREVGARPGRIMSKQQAASDVLDVGIDWAFNQWPPSFLLVAFCYIHGTDTGKPTTHCVLCRSLNQIEAQFSDARAFTENQSRITKPVYPARI